MGLRVGFRDSGLQGLRGGLQQGLLWGFCGYHKRLVCKVSDFGQNWLWVLVVRVGVRGFEEPSEGSTCKGCLRILRGFKLFES